MGFPTLIPNVCCLFLLEFGTFEADANVLFFLSLISFVILTELSIFFYIFLYLYFNLFNKKTKPVSLLKSSAKGILILLRRRRTNMYIFAGVISYFLFPKKINTYIYLYPIYKTRVNHILLANFFVIFTEI